MPKLSLSLAACVLLLAVVPLYADDAEDQAVKAVEKLGGKVIRDDKDPAHPVVEVDLEQCWGLTDAGLKELAALKGLRKLVLFSCEGVTDASLKELIVFPRLQRLDLALTKVTGTGLKDLAGLKELQTLRLSYTAVTDAGLQHLAALKGLKDLDLECTRGNGRRAEGTGPTQGAAVPEPR